jgi:hypothetical protein
MPHDIEGKEIKKGDYIQAMFRVDEVYEGTVCNLMATLHPTKPCIDVHTPQVAFQASTVNLIDSSDAPKDLDPGPEIHEEEILNIDS